MTRQAFRPAYEARRVRSNGAAFGSPARTRQFLVQTLLGLSFARSLSSERSNPPTLVQQRGMVVQPAASGHPATLLPTSAMKSRRLMGLTPKAKDHELIIAPCIAARSGHFCPLWVLAA